MVIDTYSYMLNVWQTPMRDVVYYHSYLGTAAWISTYMVNPYYGIRSRAVARCIELQHIHSVEHAQAAKLLQKEIADRKLM